MIDKLEHTQTAVARRIYQVFQSSYKIEAALIGVTDFPPLSRTVSDIEQAHTQFYGFYEHEHELAAVVEITYRESVLHINSLTVSPDHFRKGIAGKLLAFLFDTFDFHQAIVETAVVNTPAIELYKKAGFVEVKQYTPSHGIPKTVMSTQ